MGNVRKVLCPANELIEEVSSILLGYFILVRAFSIAEGSYSLRALIR